VSVSLSYQISRGAAAGGLLGVPVIRVAKSGEIRFAYLEDLYGTYAVRYVTWNGDFNQNPTDVLVSPYTLQMYEQIGFDLDPQDRPGIAYFPMDGSAILATNSGAGWQMSPFATGVTSLGAVVAFEGNGTPDVFWSPESGALVLTGLIVSSKGASGWSSANPDPQNGGAAIGVVAQRDGLGRIEVFYFSGTTELRAVGTAGAWTLGASLPNAGTYGPAISPVAFGAGGEVHVAYRDLGQVMYGYFDGCTWSTQVVDTDSTAGAELQMALDSSGAPHFSHQSQSILANPNPTAGDLWYVSPAP
jgi:hypothetical protein